MPENREQYRNQHGGQLRLLGFFLYLLFQSPVETQQRVNDIQALLEWRRMENYLPANFNTCHTITRR